MNNPQGIRGSKADLMVFVIVYDGETLLSYDVRSPKRKNVYSGETVGMLFLDPRFYERSLSFWPPHVRMAQEAGEISAELDVGIATDLIMRLVVSLVMFPQMGVRLKTRRAPRDYLQQIVSQGLGASL